MDPDEAPFDPETTFLAPEWWFLAAGWQALMPCPTLTAALGPEFISSIPRQIVRLRPKRRSGGVHQNDWQINFRGKALWWSNSAAGGTESVFPRQTRKNWIMRAIFRKSSLLGARRRPEGPPGGGLTWGRNPGRGCKYRTPGKEIPVAFVCAAFERRGTCVKLDRNLRGRQWYSVELCGTSWMSSTVMHSISA